MKIILLVLVSSISAMPPSSKSLVLNFSDGAISVGVYDD